MRSYRENLDNSNSFPLSFCKSCINYNNIRPGSISLDRYVKTAFAWISMGSYMNKTYELNIRWIYMFSTKFRDFVPHRLWKMYLVFFFELFSYSEYFFKVVADNLKKDWQHPLRYF